MPVRLGNVELSAIQSIFTEESRNLAEQRVLGQAGNIFQDLGREPVAIHLEGLIFGEEAQSILERLRQAQADAEPLAFGSDIAVGSDVTDILIEDFQARQVAGYMNRYLFTMRLREYVEPPESPAAGLGEVNAGVSADADSWAGGALGAATALQDPGSLPRLLVQMPEVLTHLDMGDLGGSLTQSISNLTGGDFGDILASVGELDPAMMGELMTAVRDAGNLGEFIQKYADEGLNILEQLSGIDLGFFVSLFQGFAGAADFLKDLKRVTEAAGDLVDSVSEFNPLEDIQQLLDGGGEE